MNALLKVLMAGGSAEKGVIKSAKSEHSGGCKMCVWV